MLPARKAKQWSAVDEESAKRGSKAECDSICSHKQRHHLGALFTCKPCGQVQQDAGEESSLCDAKKEPKAYKEWIIVFYIDEEHRDDAPRKHNSCNPLLGADFTHHQVAWNFKNEVRDEEDSSSKGILGARKPGHLQLGKVDIDAVKVGDDVKKEEKRN